jgi:hypothetical protein
MTRMTWARKAWARKAYEDDFTHRVADARGRARIPQLDLFVNASGLIGRAGEGPFSRGKCTHK